MLRRWERPVASWRSRPCPSAPPRWHPTARAAGDQLGRRTLWEMPSDGAPRGSSMAMRIASATISRTGIRTRRQAWDRRARDGMSSKPVTVRSRGTSSPRSYASWSTRWPARPSRRRWPSAAPADPAASPAPGHRSGTRWRPRPRSPPGCPGHGPRMARNASSRSRMSPRRRPPMNAIRRCPSPPTWPEDRIDARPIVDCHRRQAGRPRAVPQGDYRHAGVVEVLDELQLVAHVAQQQDRVAVAGLEDAPQGERLVRPTVRMAQDHVVAAPRSLDGDRFDGGREERVGGLRTMTPRSPVRAPRRPRASGLGR